MAASVQINGAPPQKNPKFSGRSPESSSRALADDDSVAMTAGAVEGDEEDSEAAQLFEKLKDAERVRIEKLERLENKSDIQLERQLIMASCWSRALLTLQGKLKGTEWDPENSHRIDYSEFCRLLDSNNVQYMEYSNFGQSISELSLACSECPGAFRSTSFYIFLSETGAHKDIVQFLKFSSQPENFLRINTWYILRGLKQLPLGLWSIPHGRYQVVSP